MNTSSDAADVRPIVNTYWCHDEGMEHDTGRRKDERRCSSATRASDCAALYSRRIHGRNPCSSLCGSCGRGRARAVSARPGRRESGRATYISEVETVQCEQPAVSCVGRGGQKGNGNLLHATTVSGEVRMLSAGGASANYLGRTLTQTHQRQHELRKKRGVHVDRCSGAETAVRTERKRTSGIVI